MRPRLREHEATKPRRRHRQDDRGQLMLVSGIVITIAFLLTALTLSQVTNIERQAAADKPTSLATEWRFLHDQLQANLQSAVTVDTTNDTFVNTTWPAVAASFKSIEAEKGYDLVLRLAGNTTGGVNAFNLTENGTGISNGQGFQSYNMSSFDGSIFYNWSADGKDDGLLWNPTCLDTTNGGGCIQGVLVSMHMADATTSLDEVALYAVNKG